jgi:predicted dehydrogenase
MIRIGLAGSGRIASRFVKEAKYVRDAEICGVFGIYEEEVREFATKNSLSFYSTDYDELLSRVDAVYIATPHLTHYDYALRALGKGRHVLCEKPMVLTSAEAVSLFSIADEKRLVLIEAIKTAFAPGFVELIKIAKSGLIGKIRNVEATFTKLVSGDTRELLKENAGGSMTELSTYPLTAAVKLLGTDYLDAEFHSFFDKEREIDLFSRFTLIYDDCIFTGKVGLGVKSEGDLIISGTKGYIYVPAPWWKTEHFEARFEDVSQRQIFHFPFEGDGLRYELDEFVSLIRSGKRKTDKLRDIESVAIIKVIEEFLKGDRTKRMSDI